MPDTCGHASSLEFFWSLQLPSRMCWVLCCAVLCCAAACCAGVLQSLSKLLQAGVRLWDRLHSRREEGAEADADTKEPLDGSPSLPAAAPAGSS
jgi:hypothetical protein